MQRPNWEQVARGRENGVQELFQRRQNLPPPSPATLSFKNVQVFNGHDFEGPMTVSMKGGRIVDSASDAREIDCSGKYLIPGLIDAHCHPLVPKDLDNLSKHGVTTAMSMAGFSKDHMDSLKGHHGYTDIVGAGRPAAGPDNIHVKAMPGWPKDELVTDASQADSYVERQIAMGADFMKLLSDVPGLSEDILVALAEASRKRGKLVVCHAAKLDAVRMALEARADQIHHIAMDGLVDKGDIAKFKEHGSILCPTLSVMEGLAKGLPRPGMRYEHASGNTGMLHQAGIPILCGTDANEGTPSPSPVPFGASVHHELELLVSAGLSPLEALRSATVLPPQYFGLKDRGVIAPGYRADLVLLSENPLENIAATKSIENVWFAGIEGSQRLKE